MTDKATTNQRQYTGFSFQRFFLLMIASTCMLLGAYQPSAAKPPKSTLDSPANVTASSVSENRNDLKWQYSSNKIDGFSIERSASPDFGFSEVATTGDAATSYLDVGLASGDTYYYRMRAFKKAGKDTTYSAYSQTVSATTQSSTNPGSFAFDVASYSVEEGAGSVSVTIQRLGGSDGAVTVDWRTLSDTADYSTDYGDFGWTTLSFADGETSKTKSISITDDTEVESDETFDVVLDNATGGATLDTITTSTITIIDNDQASTAQPGSFEFALSGYSVDEGAGAVAVTINRVGGSDGQVTVDWRTLSDTADYSTDYGDFGWTTLSFADGETSKTKSISITDDTEVESDETFDVLLDNATGGAALGSITASTITITDNDEAVTAQPGSFEFALSGYSVDEGAGTVAVTINRVGGSDGQVTVDWRTSGNSATYGADYGDFSWTTLTFVDGETSKTEAVAIVDDTEIESDESFDVLLDNATGGAILGSITASTITIKDNDTTTTEGAPPAPVLETVEVSGTDFILTWSQPDSVYGAPDGGYDIIIDGADTNSTNRTTSLSTTISGLMAGTHTFKVEARFTETSYNFPRSNEMSATSEASTDATIDDSSLSYLPVFPGARGFGTETQAGRGGKIIKVTNLNNSGTGSLRAAIDATGPRIVVFEVSGTITLSNYLFVKNPYLTIAGQTAPSPGITIKGAGISVKTHDVLIQHLRIRIGDEADGPTPDDRDALQILGSDTYNVVIDHISASWAIDENVSSWYSPHDVTVSNSIVSEGLDDSYHSKGPHSKGLLVGDHSKNFALIGNLLAHNVERNPRIKGDSSVLVVNNVFYNPAVWDYMGIGSDVGPNLVSAVGNVFIDGPNTPGARAIVISSEAPSGTKVYPSDNLYSGTMIKNYASFDPIVSSPPIWAPSLEARSSDTVEAWVLANAGARPADRDAVDDRVTYEVESRSGYVVDSQSEVGGWPYLAKNYRDFTIPSDPNGDDDGDGYTNIEEILHQMAAQVEGR